MNFPSRNLAIVVLGWLMAAYSLAADDQSKPRADESKPPMKPAATKKQPLSDAQRWMLAASAVLTQVNSNSHVLLAGDEHEGHDQCGKNTLKDAWDVSNRDELLGTLSWLQQQGHSAQFNQMGKDWLSHSVKERQARLTKITDEDERAQLAIVEGHAARLGAKALMAWDLGRLISVVRFAFAAGYVTEAEAWRLILPNAQKLQAHYSSWEELGREFLLGRKFWAPSNDSSRHQAAYQQLLADPASPWNTIAWKTPLK